VHFQDEVLEHLLGDGEIGDDPVLEGADGGDVAGRASEHALGLGAHRGHRLGTARSAVLADGDHRRFLRVLAVPKSMERSLEKMPLRRPNMMVVNP